MNTKDNSKICIMIVPHTKKVKKLVIPHWLPKVALMLTSIIIISLGLYFSKATTYQLNLKRTAQDKISIIQDLEEMNRQKDLELASLRDETKQLQAKAAEVENKLLEINSLQKTLEEMAGIDSPSKGADTIASNISFSDLDPSSEMDILAEVLDDKKIELEVFIEDLEVQFAYLETVPDLMPTSGRITSRFGNRKNPFGRGIQFHQGVDIANSRGTKVVASAKGTVIFAGYKGGYGRTVIIDHGNEYKTLYAHNSSLLVSVGDKVDKGQIISKMGSTGVSTGNHLHFEIHKNNKYINPLTVIKD